MTAAPTAEIPLTVRTSMGHAAVQFLARSAGVDVLHIKGVAADASLRAPRGPSNDVDVLVRPAHLQRFLRLLPTHGWTRLTSFQSGSAFEHAAVWHHPTWGSMDLHRRWPGLDADPERAFDELWAGRHPFEIAGVPCDVPSRPAQALILLLHAARGPADRHEIERQFGWFGLAPEEQEEVERLVTLLGAEVPFALVMGRFDEIRQHRTADLWWTVSHGGSRLQEWKARLKAASSRREALRTAIGGLVISRDYMRLELQREPTAADLVRANGERVGHALRDLASMVRSDRA